MQLITDIDQVHEELRNGCTGFTDLVVEPRALLVDGHPDRNPVALRSAIVLDGPASIQESFSNYRKLSFSIGQINEMLTRWKDTFFQVRIDRYLMVCCYRHHSVGDRL